jgi:hypothetical protein
MKIEMCNGCKAYIVEANDAGFIYVNIPKVRNELTRTFKLPTKSSAPKLLSNFQLEPTNSSKWKIKNSPIPNNYDLEK